MKKNKNIASIFVIIGGVLVIAGIVVKNFVPEKEKEYKSHVVEEKDLCEQTLYEEKTKIIAVKYSDIKENYEYKLATNQFEFDEYISDYEYELEDVYFDHSNYDYLIYYIDDGNLCNKSKLLTNYSINNNIIELEFTKNELNQTTCNYNIKYAYVLEIEKYQLSGDFIVKTTTKEDPYKECYKK